MKGRELLIKLGEEIAKDDLLEEEVVLLDILDYLGCMGVEGASEMYLYLLRTIAVEA